ncbi:MAG: calcium-binding protein [Solirubrobacteraceae bacterium]
MGSSGADRITIRSSWDFLLTVTRDAKGCTVPVVLRRPQGGGRSNRDLVLGRGGDDVIDSGAGGDHLEGEGGDDRLRGGAGDDLLYGRKGDDRVRRCERVVRAGGR